jgi:hypothetical protein
VRAWLVCLLTAVVATVFAPAALADVGDSSNWAGYAVHDALFHRVSAQWVQPAVQCVRGHDSYSAYWVGLGGYSGSALEQIGTEADCGVSGRPSLSAWYEMVPAPSMPVALSIDPGDRMGATVTVIGHRATLTLRDLTRHHSFSTTVGSRFIDVSSAEWIVEAPSDCLSTCLTLPLANFGSAAFTAARAEGLDGHWGTITDAHWQSTEIRLVPGGAHASSAGFGPGIAAPSVLSAGGSAFSVSFARYGAPRRARLRPEMARAGRVAPGRLVHPGGAVGAAV